MTRLFGSALAALMVVGCAKNIAQRVSEPSLMHTWEGACNDGGPIDLSYRTFVKYAGDKFEETTTFYSSEDCVEPAAEVRYHGSFTLRDAKEAASAKPIDFDYEESEALVLNDAGKKAFEAVEPCGFETWEINKAHRLTNLAKGVKCPFRVTPSRRFGIYRLENDKLIVGDKFGFDSVATVESERPTKLDDNNPLKISQRKL